MLKEASLKLISKVKYSLPLPYLLIAIIFSYILTTERLAVTKVCYLFEAI